MRLSLGIRGKIAAAVAALILVLFSAFSVLAIWRLRANMLGNLDRLEKTMVKGMGDQALNITTNAAMACKTAIVGHDFAFLGAVVDESVGSVEDLVYGAVLVADGEIRVERLRDGVLPKQETATPPADDLYQAFGPLVEDPAIVKLVDSLRGKEAAETTDRFRLGDHEVFAVYVPVVVSGKQWGAVLFTFSLNRLTAEVETLGGAVRNEIWGMAERVFLGSVGLLAIGVLAVWLIAQVITRSIHQLHESVIEVGEGNLDQEVAVNSDDEIGELATAFNKMVRDLQRHMALTAEKERMEVELRTARTIQQTLLPQVVPDLPQMRICGKSITSTEVGGDFYDFFALGDGGSGAAVVVGDATGHGVGAGLVVAAGKSCILSALYADGGPFASAAVAPSRVLNLLNRVICGITKQEYLMTLVYASYDSCARELTVANAGHPFPYLYRARSGQLEQLAVIGFPLGADEDMSFVDAKFSVEPGDVLVYYTDGLFEGTNSDGEPYGFERLEETIRKNVDLDPEPLKEAILSDAFRFFGSGELEDDLTIVVAKFD